MTDHLKNFKLWDKNHSDIFNTIMVPSSNSLLNKQNCISENMSKKADIFDISPSSLTGDTIVKEIIGLRTKIK